MGKLHWIIATFFFTSTLITQAAAQDTIYTFPFSLESKLLVFEGEMNGVKTDFAFDTGAAMGLANTHSEPLGRLKIKGKKIKLSDSNQQVKKVPTGVTDEFKIGGFTFSKVRSLVNDMTFLYCMDYFLLGSDIIKQLNWEIDFDRMQIRVSKSPFPVDPAWAKLPIHYAGNRPFVKLAFAGKTFPDALVDFGYVQVMDFPDHLPEIKDFLATKDSLGLSNPNISTAMGALGKKTFPTRSIWVDSLSLGRVIFDRVPVDFEESSYPKLGLGFFKSLSHKTILNHSENSYYLHKREGAEFATSNQVGVLYQDGKLILSAKPVGMTPNDTKIEIGEEIRSINGFSAADFSGMCSFFTWSVTQNTDQVTLVKLDGTSLTFPKIPLK
jgi:hypothetical protein